METRTIDISVVWPNYFEDCAQCVDRLREALSGLHGVFSVEIDARRRSIVVSYDPDLLNFAEIQDHARLVGVTVEQKYRHEIITILGLDCPDCAINIENAIRRINGVIWATLSYATSRLIVEYHPDVTNIQTISARVSDLGYEALLEVPTRLQETRARVQRNARLLLTCLAGVLLASGWISSWIGAAQVANLLFIASAIFGGLFAARVGLLSVRSLTLDTNFLVSVAAVGAIWLGDYSEAAIVMFLFSLGSALEAHTVEKTRRSIKSLIQSVPTKATVVRGVETMEIPVEQVNIGDVVLARPGERIAVDGSIIEGASSVIEAPITGEAMPKSKSVGDRVFAGTINGSGALQIMATSTYRDNTLARIVHMVEEAQGRKAPSQRFSERFGRIYTPTVLIIAAVVAVLGSILSPTGPQNWINKALTLLVVSCPCALVISTPVAIFAAIGSAARNGVLIKGGAYLETLGAVQVIAFDKTGTLTQGRPSITDVVPLNTKSAADVLAVAAAVESRSEHPLAESIIRCAENYGAEELPVAFFEALPGRGARAVVGDRLCYVGSKRLMREIGLDVPNAATIAELRAVESNVIYVADDSSLLGALVAKDELKPGSATAIAALKAIGLRKVVILTGDTQQSAQAVAQSLQIEEVFAELLPEDKVARIREIRAASPVAMVGDGINDAPALAAADIGVAMGGAGNEAAIEAADVVLMADDIGKLPYAIDLSREARSVIRQNVAFALAVVVLLVVGALTSAISLSIGILGHEGSALLVIANSMRLLKR